MNKFNQNLIMTIHVFFNTQIIPKHILLNELKIQKNVVHLGAYQLSIKNIQEKIKISVIFSLKCNKFKERALYMKKIFPNQDKLIIKNKSMKIYLRVQKNQ